MSQKTYALVSGLIFLAITVMHALRLLYGWGAVINNWAVPMWLSGAGVVVAGYLAYHGLKMRK
jgi:hypothetical protein